ncbi:glycosyltransferase family 2 protein [Gloeobacter kilaueensis]|uniref:Glycosyl transferase n=1 Tax=Gloeobacter kilaueensis (strain ATCC BAA-2537 / CCAP 1431/1 / ULC 316 / JS1) TaxID=1183438 RepID=U5QJN3_GLOK1|nr:glycosyltransferase family 2 protein [Gloeobacter kilaueensis]AGY57860.1 glycosyl transferase [Gloeobacter kilaueensis JS1]
MLASIVIRTYNEQRYLPQLLEAVAEQTLADLGCEVIVVDSGSSDRTVQIAQRFGCRLVHIQKADFSFGRSLNLGCQAARGEYLVFISGHCVPTSSQWLAQLLHPLQAQRAVLTYGRQLGGEQTRFSEKQVFSKFYPPASRIPQTGFFCNNANAALLRPIWLRNPFNEALTGLEDMELGKRLIAQGLQIAYVAEAAVWHYHDESWSKVLHRYEREAIALQHIMPEVHIHFLDFLRYLTAAIWSDSRAAIQSGLLGSKLKEICLFRLMQFWGSYRGNWEHRTLSRHKKEMYFGYLETAAAAQSAAKPNELETTSAPRVDI